MLPNNIKTAEKGVQDNSCRVSGGFPQLWKVPKDWGIRGLIETISAVSYNMEHLEWFTGPTDAGHKVNSMLL